jgi:hypothetical protein
MASRLGAEVGVVGEWLGRWGAYLISFVLTTAVVVYVLNLPAYLSGAPKLVHEYYYTHFWKSNVLDVFLIAAYIWAGMVLAGVLGIAGSTAGQVTGIAVASAAISSAFAAWFIFKPRSSSFFSRWFHAAGWSAVLYDVIIVTTIYWVAAAGKRQLTGF